MKKLQFHVRTAIGGPFQASMIGAEGKNTNYDAMTKQFMVVSTYSKLVIINCKKIIANCIYCSGIQ